MRHLTKKQLDEMDKDQLWSTAPFTKVMTGILLNIHTYMHWEADKVDRLMRQSAKNYVTLTWKGVTVIGVLNDGERLSGSVMEQFDKWFRLNWKHIADHWKEKISSVQLYKRIGCLDKTVFKDLKRVSHKVNA